MRKHTHSYLAAASCGLAVVFLFPRPVRADRIVAIVDEHGRKIYVNTGEPATRVDWMTRSFRSSRTPAIPPAEINRLVEQTADRHEVDPQLVHAIIKAESDYNPNAVSPKGAMGLMQLIPATARRFGVNNPFDPKQNLEVDYLKYLLNLFGGDLTLSLAAYNAGENSVLRSGGVPAIAETRNYVRKVQRLYKSETGVEKSQLPQEPPKAPIIRYVDAQGVVHYTNVE
jgi:soluble lytic murein transglycosylase-like protein